MQSVTHFTGVNTSQTVNYVRHVFGVLLQEQMDSGWVPAATINKTAPVSRPVLINSASDVFLCVYLTSEKELEDKRFPRNGNNGFITRTRPGSTGLQTAIIPCPTAFPYGNGMVLHFYQQQESSTTKTVHKVINKGLKAYV